MTDPERSRDARGMARPLSDSARAHLARLTEQHPRYRIALALDLTRVALDRILAGESVHLAVASRLEAQCDEGIVLLPDAVPPRQGRRGRRRHLEERHVTALRAAVQELSYRQVCRALGVGHETLYAAVQGYAVSESSAARIESWIAG